MNTRARFALLFTVVVFGCGDCGADEHRCTTADDCKGIRMCVDGACETPNNDPDSPSNVASGPNSATGPCAPACTGESLCARGECREICDIDEDCGTAEVCSARAEGPGRVCYPGYQCNGTGGMNDERQCVANFDCGEGGAARVHCRSDGGNLNQGPWSCDCVVADEVTSTFMWDGAVCELAIGFGDSPQYLCGWDTLFF